MTAILDHPLELSYILFLLLVVAVEIGFRLAIATGAISDDDRREQIFASRDALGILLSLLLGFTLAMALPRYDLRRQLLMDEANSIGTTRLRAGLLPEAQRDRVRALSIQYVDARLAYSRAQIGTDEFSRAIEQTNKLQAALWQEALEASGNSPGATTALFVASLNETIDLSEKRLAALENRIPNSIWIMLILIASLTCLTFGYGQRRRFWLITIVTPLMIAIVMGLIADLNAPRSGLIRADLNSLERLSRDLRQMTPGSAAPDLPNRR